MSFRDKLAEVMVMVAVEWVGTPAWRRSYHDADTSPTVIIEGGLVRDVTGVEQYDVLDLDTDVYTSVEEFQDLLSIAEGLPEDYPGRDSIIANIHEDIANWQE